jgi:hypothetical protein
MFTYRIREKEGDGLKGKSFLKAVTELSWFLRFSRVWFSSLSYFKRSIVVVVLGNRWYWFIVLGCSSVMVLPWAIVLGILTLPPVLRPVVMVLILIGYGIASGLKDYSLKEEEYLRKVEKELAKTKALP